MRIVSLIVECLPVKYIPVPYGNYTDTVNESPYRTICNPEIKKLRNSSFIPDKYVQFVQLKRSGKQCHHQFVLSSYLKNMPVLHIVFAAVQLLSLDR